ncbi:hypothetical protein LCGC14_2287830 [marine sediment metagenome]|uniref:Uncharacterized protein n=1 Tax=marine sediment metagenome TaxID=412755 RepID=A0A0F9DEN7_9ZZZZ
MKGLILSGSMAMRPMTHTQAGLLIPRPVQADGVDAGPGPDGVRLVGGDRS